MTTYIVTGGFGFVGSNLVAALLKREPRPLVIVIDSGRSGSFANLVEACERAGVGPFDGRVIARSSAEVDWFDLIEHRRPEAVFHLGAITDTTVSDEALMLHENVGGFATLLRACGPDPIDPHGQPSVPLVYASSAATYGTPPQTRARAAFPESAAGRPSNVYGFSKWLMEVEHRRWASEPRHDQWERELPEPHVVGLRYFNVFGPGESRKGKMASMVYQIGQRMLAGERPRVFKHGEQARDQVYVEDVVSCTLAAAGLDGRKVTPGVYNLGSGVATSFNEIIDALWVGLHGSKGAETEYIEMPPSIRTFYQDWTLADMSRTREGLGWSPAWKPTDAITAYARFMKAQHGGG